MNPAHELVLARLEGRCTAGERAALAAVLRYLDRHSLQVRRVEVGAGRPVLILGGGGGCYAMSLDRVLAWHRRLQEGANVDWGELRRAGAGDPPK